MILFKLVDEYEMLMFIMLIIWLKMLIILWYYNIMYVVGLRVIYFYKVKNVNIYFMNSLIFKIFSKLF